MLPIVKRDGEWGTAEPTTPDPGDPEYLDFLARDTTDDETPPTPWQSPGAGAVYVHRYIESRLEIRLKPDSSMGFERPHRVVLTDSDGRETVIWVDTYVVTHI